METQKLPEFCQIRQTKMKLCRMDRIRKKSNKNWETARNIFCLSDNFQICQNFLYLAAKAAIWPR
jgi:hypothetical protein